MRALTFSKFFLPMLTFALVGVASPAEAGRTVVDGGQTILVNGYCTPDGGPDCAPQALPFGLTLGGTTYNTFILNGNGTLTLGDTAIDWTSVANSPPSLSGFTMPIFSPQMDNTITLMGNALDPSLPNFQETRWAASIASTPGSLTAYWFVCSSAIFCGTESLSAIFYDFGAGGLTLQEVIDRQSWNMFGMTLTDLGSGFQLDYFYYPAFAISPTFEYYPIVPNGTYGFNLPGAGSLQSTGPLVDRSWTFNQAVPEPGTWVTMLVGFAAIGLTLRRQRPRKPSRIWSARRATISAHP